MAGRTFEGPVVDFWIVCSVLLDLFHSAATSATIAFVVSANSPLGLDDCFAGKCHRGAKWVNSTSQSRLGALATNPTTTDADAEQ